jgi:hypothetical protein
MRMLPLIAAALALAAPSGTLAEGADCVLGQTSAEDASAIGSDMLSGGSGATGEIGERMTGHVAACVERFGWDEAQTLRVSTLSLTAMARGVALERLAGVGIDAAALDRWFDAQSEAFRTRAFVDMSEEEAVPVLETLAENTISAEQFEQNAELIGGYLASRVMVVRAELGLPLQ